MNPFEPWLPTYARDQSSGPMPARPWWRISAATIGASGVTYPLTRCDAGPLSSGRLRVSVPPPGEDVEDVDAYIFGHVTAAVDAYDDAHPMPVPPPMCGQVWVRPDETCMVTGTNAGAYQFGGVTLPLSFWPPPNAVLVAGPFSPWVPKGWRP